MSSDPEKRYLLTHELAARLRVQVQTLRKWRVENLGPPYFKFGKRVCYRVADIEQWEAANRRDPGSPKAAS